MLKGQARLAAAVASALGLSFGSLAFGQPVIDGTLDDGLYTRFATQTVNTGFGDNQSELNAGYARIEGGKLYLMLTGNVESNFNKLTIWFDTRDGGQNVMRNDNPNADFNNLNRRYAGMTFDTGFEPDYTFFYSRDVENAFLNFSELNTTGGGLGGYLGQVGLPNPGQQGAGIVGGAGGLPSIEFGYADFNVGGVSGDAPNAADPAAAEAVTSGTELAIDLPALGALGNFKIMVAINGSSQDYWSNQFLPGLAAPQGNLGGDGLGTYVTKPDPDDTEEPIDQIGHVGLVNFANIAGDQFLTLNYTVPSFEWDNAAGGAWTGAANWTADTVPNAIDAIATLGSVAGASARNVTLDSDVRVQRLNIDSAGGYTVSGTGTLTVAGNPASPSVVVSSGNHSINAALALGATTNFGIAAGSTLNVGNLVTNNQVVVKSDAGVLQVNNVRTTQNLGINAGTVRIAPNGGAAGVSVLQSISFDGGATPTAALDLTNNGLVFEYNPGDPPTFTPYEGLKGLLLAGRAGGSWTGNGITSSSAAAAPGTFGVGIAEASLAAPGGTFLGQTVDTSAILFRYTRLGDSNLDGLVNLDDFTALAGGFGVGTEWIQGDFNYDGAVNLDDFTALANNFGLSIPADLGRASVPEPTALGVLAIAGMALARRRRA